MRTIVVGAGQAGAWVARTLRELDPHESIILIGSETDAPYERPLLSKDVLVGKAEAPPCLLTVEQAENLNIMMRLGLSVLAIDRLAKSLTLSDGTTLDYDRLVLATGGRPRVPELAGIDLAGVHTLRTMSDARRLKSSLRAEKRLLVLGGGWIGLEVAASARSLGLHVTLIEGGDRLCARSVPHEISMFLLERHTREGVDVQLNGSLISISKSKHGKLLAMTHQGIQEFDSIVVGIGLQPNTELAKASNLSVDNGIIVDTYGRTSDPSIFAVGDVTNQSCSWMNAPPGTRVRLESWANAQNQGIGVGRALAGLEPQQQELPWFWSDQYDVNLQVLGMPDNQALTVRRGSQHEERFCLFQFVDSRLHAAVAVNMPRELKLAKRWMTAGVNPSPAELSDPDFRIDKFRPVTAT